MNKRTFLILGAVVLVAIPTTYFAYAATLGVSSSKITVHREGATIAVPTPTPSPVGSVSPAPSSTPTGPSAKTCTLRASQDAYVDENAAKTANFGSQTTIAVRSERGKKNRRSFVQFDIASCAIPSGATVTSASFKLTTAVGPASARTYVLHSVTGGWSETGITNQSEPSVASASSGSVASGSTLTWTVTSDVAGFVSSPATNFGWRVADSVQDASAAVESSFHAREATIEASRPTLVINYSS